MTPRDETTAKIVREWVEKAEEDWFAADRLSAEEGPVSGVVAFHSQQLVEKYIKATLTAAGQAPPQTHDMRRLLDLLAESDTNLAEAIRDTEALTGYAVRVRYPIGFQSISMERARQVFRMATRARDTIRAALADYLNE